jgi:hypothetical protein
MKAIIVFCMFLIAMPVFAGIYRDDFEKEQDFISDCKNGVWLEDTNLYAWESGYIKATYSSAGSGLVTGDLNWKDYTVECRIKPIQVEQVGISILIRRTCTFCLPCYNLGLTGKEANIYVDAMSYITGSPFELEMGKWYVLKAVAQGSKIEFYVDGKLVAKTEDSKYPAGRAGFGVFGEALFDDFVMTGPDVKDGGHWDPKVHEQLSAVKPQNKLAGTWGQIKK